MGTINVIEVIGCHHCEHHDFEICALKCHRNYWWWDASDSAGFLWCYNVFGTAIQKFSGDLRPVMYVQMRHVLSLHTTSLYQQLPNLCYCWFKSLQSHPSLPCSNSPKLKVLVQKFKGLQKKRKREKKTKHIHPVFISPRCTSSLLCVYKPKLSKWMKITDSRLGATVADRADHFHACRTLSSSDGARVLAAMLLCECPWVFF